MEAPKQPVGSEMRFLQRRGVQLAAGVVALGALSLIFLGASSWGKAMFFGPIMLGALTTTATHSALSQWIHDRVTWLERLTGWASMRSSRIARYIVGPAARGSRWLWDKSESVRNDHLRAGIRVSAMLYLSTAVAGLAAIGVYILIGIAITVLFIGLLGWLLSLLGEGDTEGRSSNVEDRGTRKAAGVRGTRAFRRTGILSEEGSGRIDDEGRIWEPTGVFSEAEVGRIDDEGRVFERTGVFSEEQTHRVDEDGRIFRRTGMLSEDEVGRVDSDGRVFKKTGILSEEEIGRIEDA